MIWIAYPTGRQPRSGENSTTLETEPSPKQSSAVNRLLIYLFVLCSLGIEQSKTCAHSCMNPMVLTRTVRDVVHFRCSFVFRFRWLKNTFVSGLAISPVEGFIEAGTEVPFTVTLSPTELDPDIRLEVRFTNI